MKNASHVIAHVTLVALTALLGSQTFAAEKKPLNAFILAGQSNLQGHAKVRTELGFARQVTQETKAPIAIKYINVTANLAALAAANPAFIPKIVIIPNQP